MKHEAIDKFISAVSEAVRQMELSFFDYGNEDHRKVMDLFRVAINEFKASRKEFDSAVNACAESLYGNPELFRGLLSDPSTILERMCRNAELVASRKNSPVWSVIGQWTGHGSGVSSAIYNLYGPKKPTGHA